MGEKIIVIIEQFHENVRSKTSKCRKLSHSSEMQNYALVHREGSAGYPSANHDYIFFINFICQSNIGSSDEINA